MLRFLLSCFLLLLLLPYLTLAQHGRVTGLLCDEHQQPVPFATVVLLNPTDSTLLAGTTTETNGHFLLTPLPLRAYVLVVSAVGYVKVRQPVTLSTAQPTLDLPSILLPASPHTLAEGVVEGKPPLVQVEGDKLVVNVAANATQTGLNGLEVLAKVPGVTVNRSTDQVSVRNQTPLIMLDGRPTYLTAEQLTQLLKSLRSDDIATIEVIQNPSARYEAAGTGGILNIRTKKAQQYGSFYTLQAGGASGHFGRLGGTLRHNESLTFSRRGRRGSLYLAAGNDYAQSIGEQRRDQTLFTAGEPVEQRQNHYRNRTLLHTQRLTANTEWYLTPRTTLSVQAQHTWSRTQYQQQIEQQFRRPTDSTGLLTDMQRRTPQRYLTGSVQLQHRFDSLGRQLTVALDAARVHSQQRTTFAYQAYALATPTELTPSSNQLDNPFLNPIYTGQIDYVHPTRRGQRWETGAKLSRTDNRTTYATDFVGGQLQSDYFRFREQISAAYAQWAGSWHAYQLQAGLRAEHTHATGHDGQGQQTVRRNYLNVFPSASVAHALGSQQQLTLAYSRRIDRPNYYQFSPFRRFTSRFEYTQGDARLNPFITNSISLRHVWKEAIVTSFSYDRATRVYSAYYVLDQTTLPGETLVRTSFLNTQPRQVAWYNLNGTVPLDPLPWLHLDMSYWYSYRIYQNTVNDATVSLRAGSFGGDVTASLTLPHAVVLEVAADGVSSYPMGAFEKSRPQVQVDFGLRKSFAQKRGTLKLNLTDPFDLSRYNVRIASPALQAYNQSRGTNRLLRLQLTYNLGNTNARTGSRALNTQENTNRSGNGA